MQGCCLGLALNYPKVGVSVTALGEAQRSAELPAQAEQGNRGLKEKQAQTGEYLTKGSARDRGQR